MAAKVVISPTAQRDLLDIIDFIAADNPARALSFVGELEQRARGQLATFPKGGRAYKNRLRFIVIERYVVVYDFDEAANLVAIHHVHGAGENWRAE